MGSLPESRGCCSQTPFSVNGSDGLRGGTWPNSKEKTGGLMPGVGPALSEGLLELG